MPEECLAAYPQLSGPIGEMARAVLGLRSLAICAAGVETEAAIASALYATPGVIGNFQDKGSDSPPADGEPPIGCLASCAMKFLRLPERLPDATANCPETIPQACLRKRPGGLHAKGYYLLVALSFKEPANCPKSMRQQRGKDEWKKG
jgi:hypothetical protein